MKKFLTLPLVLTLGCDAEPKGRPGVVDLSEAVFTQEGDFQFMRQQHGVTMADPGSVQHVMDSELKRRVAKGLTDFQYTVVDQTMGSAPLHTALDEEKAEVALAIQGEAFSLQIANNGKYIVNNLHIFETQDEVSNFLLTSGLNDKVTAEQITLLSWNVDKAVDDTTPTPNPATHKWGFIKKTIASIFKPILDKWAEGKCGGA